ncbi:MAG: MetS family NSS transporter small subunit [Ignavibacteria bacterium]|nr:MetS family NSS transporter small subunit [Ignavibacteria bacterium]
MNLVTIITMICVLGLVWGGLIFFISKAFKHEKLKLKNGKE